MENKILLDDATVLKLEDVDRRNYYAIKRFVDFTFSLLLLVLLSPLLLVIALLIFIYSPGPIFFIQERVGAKRQYLKWTFTLEKSVFLLL